MYHMNLKQNFHLLQVQFTVMKLLHWWRDHLIQFFSISETRCVLKQAVYYVNLNLFLVNLSSDLGTSKPSALISIY